MPKDCAGACGQTISAHAEKDGSEILDVLKNTFGYSSFRKGQAEVVDGIMSGRDVLAIMPTGGGKSLCYQLPAVLNRGVTVVISPLISLMKDQVDSLRQNGVRAASINSSMEWDDISDIFRAARRGEISLLYIAPERLAGEGFLSFLRSLDISLIVVDEAHCVSHWGHDFRPSYLNIASVAESLDPRPPVAAFTATATHEVRADIVTQLGLDNPLSISTGFDRANLFFQVEHPADKMHTLLNYIKNYPSMSGIVYCSTRRDVEMVCEKLREKGVSAVRYHAGLEDSERTKNQDAFIYDRANVIVATNAFGMGIDKSNVRFVIHYNMPGNLDSYYQEAGRAGRDGLPADCILLFGTRDISTARYLISHSGDKETIPTGLRKLQTMVDYCNTDKCLRAYILNYFGDRGAPHNCASCGSCTSVAERADITVEAKKILSCVFRMEERTGGKYGTQTLIDVLRGSQEKRICFLELDKISTWGLLKGHSADRIRDMINFLIASGYLKVDEGEYATLSFTDKTQPFLWGSTKLMMRRYEKKAMKTKKLKAAGSVIIGDSAALFGKLRELRKELAASESVPPYVIFSDKTLLAMCETLPRNAEEFINTPGVGSVKLNKYGADFLEAIREWK